MAKVLLVEDDNNLREIFEMRLQAEGYETVTAGDGEQALVVAMKEKPDLIIADVMMPHLSGFEMLETLRAAPGMADTKVVMMTALGQAEDQARGEKLGVVKYLVKSQVTLEDFARVIREVLPPGNQGTKQTNQESEKSMQDDASNKPADDQSGGANPISGAPADSAATDGQKSSADAQSGVNSQINDALGDAPAGSGAPAAPTADDGAGAGDVPVADPPADPNSKPADDSTPPADTSGSL